MHRAAALLSTPVAVMCHWCALRVIYHAELQWKHNAFGARVVCGHASQSKQSDMSECYGCGDVLTANFQIYSHEFGAAREK